MDFRNILQSLNTISEGDVSHKGTYGTSYGKEDVRDQYGHKVGKIDKGAEGKKEAPKRGRGRPTKGDKDEHGHDTKFDTSGLQGMLGGKPKGEVGKKSVKHSLKEYIEEVETNQQLDESEDVAEAKPGYPASRNALDLQPFNGSGPGAGFGGRSNVLPIIPNNMPGGRNMPAGAGGPKWVPTKIPGVKVHVGPPPTSTPAGSTPKLPANYELPAVSRKIGATLPSTSKPAVTVKPGETMNQAIQNRQIEKEFGNFLKGQGPQTLGTPAKPSGLGSLGAERPGSSFNPSDPLNLPRPPGSGLDEADEISTSNPGKFTNQEYKDSLNQRYGQPDLDTSKMNKQHQDFYNKNPSFKQSGKEVTSVGDRLASKVVPAVTDTKVGRIPMNTPGVRGGGGMGGGTGLGGKRPGDDSRINPLRLEGKKDLPGNQDKLDVAPPKGKLTSADFKALSKKKKVKESNIMSIVESINFKELMANADADVQEMLMELQNDVEMFKETGNSSELLDSFLKVHLHKKNKITDESMFDEEVGAGRGVVNPPVVNTNAPVPPARTASPGWGKDDYEPLIPSKPTDSAMGVIKGGTWQSDPKGTVKAPSGDPEGVREAGSFIRGLAASRKTFEGKTMKDVQLESWEKELNNLLNEGITVSTSTGQQGAPDSVSINATDSDANELLNILRQSGMGVFGGNDKPTMTPYGVVSQGEEEPTGTGTEPEMSPEVVGDGDDMLSLIKKMSGLSAGPVGQEPEGTASSDYEDEEGSEDSGEEQDAEQDSSEEEQTDEGNMFTGNLAKARAAGKKEADLDGDGDMEKVHEGHDHEECNECGYAMESCECEEQVEEGFSNDAGGDAMANTELAKLKALLTMGDDLHKMKRSQSVGNPTQVSMAESLAQWKRLSGIK